MPIPRMTLRELVATHPASISVLERFQIDLCAMGGMTLGEACAALSLSLDQVEEKLATILPEQYGATDPAALTPIQLIQRIVRVHHRRVRQDLPALTRMAERLAGKHAWSRAQAATLLRLLQQLHLSLLRHIDAEENLVFPGIAQLAENPGTPLHTVQPLHQSMRRMHKDHQTAMQTLHELRGQTNGFTPPTTACTTHRALCRGLYDFEQDLQTHLHLEDDILFPRALALQTALHAIPAEGSRA